MLFCVLLPHLRPIGYSVEQLRSHSVLRGSYLDNRYRPCVRVVRPIASARNELVLVHRLAIALVENRLQALGHQHLHKVCDQ